MEVVQTSKGSLEVKLTEADNAIQKLRDKISRKAELYDSKVSFLIYYIYDITVIIIKEGSFCPIVFLPFGKSVLSKLLFILKKVCQFYVACGFSKIEL